MSMGVSFLANIAGLQNISTELYEAGAIDGIRSRWHELWYITLPSMKSILLFSMVMQIQAVFSVSTLITTLVGYPSVNNSVDTLVSYISDVATSRYEMGYASALSVILFLIVLIFRYLIGMLLNLIGKSDS
jgi:multiple sugar transport system permease protein